MKKSKMFRLVVVFLLFFSTIDVNALSFRNKKLVCYDNNFKYSPNSGMCTGWKKSSSGNNAYCMDRGLSFAEGTSHSLDKNFGKAKSCVYYLPTDSKKNGKTIWKKRNGGDCSSILGYIIHQANVMYKDAGDEKKWYMGQIAVWTYLGKFAPNEYKNHNRSASSAWTNNSEVKKIIRKAWKNYGASAAVVDGMEKDDVKFTVEVSDKKFHYNPNSATSCGGGNYLTGDIIIKNDEVDKKITVSIPVSSDAVKICVKDSMDCYRLKKNDDDTAEETLVRTLEPGQSLTIYMSTDYILNKNVELSVTASYEDVQKISTNIYDSKRYKKSSQYQNMLILVKKKKEESASVVHESHKDITFTQVAITHKVCPSNVTSGNGKYSSNTATDPESKVCANNAETNGSIDKNAYSAYFTGCSCMAVDLGDGKKVNILLSENVGFQFGNLTPATVYPGGGFSFAKTGEGISTQYVDKISWEFADYDNNGVPYYFNPNNKNAYNANNIIGDFNNGTGILGALKKLFSDKVTLNMVTRDSNDANNSSDVRVPIILKTETITYNNDKKLFTLKSGDISMNEAYFSTAGVVSYERNDSLYPDNGGNKYYVPLRYSLKSFPFDLGVSNLSSLSNGSFYIKAECDVPVDSDYTLDVIRYRSISLTDPFSKATQKSDIPANWREWYWNNSTNQQRLKNTFINYPSQPLYEVNINSAKLSEIRNMSQNYTSWSGIRANGSSDFVLKNFSKYPNGSSYCSIGSFSATCDR